MPDCHNQDNGGCDTKPYTDLLGHAKDRPCPHVKQDDGTTGVQEFACTYQMFTA